MTKISSSKKLWGKLLLSLLLAFVLSATLFIGACGKTTQDKDDTDTEDTETLPEDDQILKNGNFEIVSSKATYPITSPNSWGSRSFASTGAGGSNSPTSSFASGVIHAGKEIDDLKLTGEYADKQKESLKNLGITTRRGESEETDNPHILMIANHRSDHTENTDEGDTSEKKLGTSQRFQSSTTLTIAQGTAVKISVWVRTIGDGENGSLLNYRGESVSSADAAKAGAYIGFTNTIGGSEVAPFHIKNINTNGEWTEYTFLIEASDYTSTKIRMILGLGYGSDSFKEYAEGFAFFDDISYSVIPISDKFTDEDVKAYENADYDILNDSVQTIFKIEDGDKVVRNKGEAVLIESDSLVDLNEGQTDQAPNFASKLSFAYGFSDSNEFNDIATGNISIDLTRNTVKDKADKVAPHNPQNDGISKIYTLDALKNSPTFREEISLSKFLEKYPFEPSDKILFMGMLQPSSYTAKISALNSAAFELGKDEYYSLSVWIKTSEKIGSSGVTLTVTDKGKSGDTKEEDYLKQTFSGINTTTTEKENDYYDGWSKYTFYISNTSDIDHEFVFEITLGLTTIVDEANDNSHLNKYDSGYAAFTNLSYQKVSKSIYDVASASSENTKTISLTAGVGSSNTTAFDSIIDSALTDAIKSGAVAPKNYLGINGGTSANGTGEHADSNLNADVISGIIDRDSLNAAYLNNIGLASGFTLKASGITPYRPLLINNTKAASYGYVSSSKTLAANSLTLINVRLRVLGSAEAYVYLSSTKSGFPLLSLNVPEIKDEDGEIIYAGSENFIYQSYKNPSGVEDSGWINMRFYIKAGDNLDSYKIELFNGSRDAKTLSTGAILFESINTKSVEQAEYSARLEVVSEDNDNAVKFTQQILRNEDDEYEEMVVFVSGTWDNTYPVMFADFSPIDVVVPDETDDEDIDEPIDEDTTTARPKSDIWLMISSLILSLALIFTLVVVAAKKFRARIAGKKSSAKTIYKGKVKHFTKSQKETDLIPDTKKKNDEPVDADEYDVTDDEDEFE